MAYNQKQYDGMKSAYERMTDEQKKQAVEQYKNNAEFQSFANDYAMGGYGKSVKSTQSTSMSNPAPVENNQQNQASPNGQNWGNGDGNQQTSPSPQPSYDPNGQFDSSAFNNPNAQVKVQAGNAKQTGMPDYQDDSDARMGEITNNLNAYWNTNREYFSDRQTFNKVFSYEKRSKAQQAHFDSFWKRKEIDKKVAGYTDGKSVSLALEEGTLTKAQLEALKVQNPKVYTEYLEDQLNKKNLDLVNTGSKSRIFNEDEQISHNTDALTDMMRKLGFDMSADGRAKELYEKFKELKNDPKIDTMKQDYLEARTIYLQRRREFNTLPDRIRAQSGGASETLISARISKAQRLAYNELQTLADEAQIRKEEYVLEYGEMKDEFNAFKMQADEEYRAFTSKMTALGFAKGILSFETPEQQRQGQIRQMEAQNEIALKQQKNLNDLNLQFAKDKANLENQLSDLSTSDPEQLKANLNNALTPYFEKYGAIIMRSQAGVVEDVLALAQKEGISVAKALEKNFIAPLQAKKEYKMMLNKQMGYTGGQKVVNVGGKSYVQTTNSDGTISFSSFETGGNESGVLDFLAGENNIGDISKNEDLLKKYPNEASYKNNNPTGITWGVSNELKQKWEDAGVKFEKGTPRPKQEGGNYVKFATMDEGLRAYKIAFTQNGGSDIFERLKKWKGAGSEADKESYALSIMKQAGIVKGEKFSGLSNEKMNALLNAHLRRESPGLYKELSKRITAVSESTELSVDEIMSFNDKSLNRKLSNEERKRIGDMKNKVMSDPNADIEKILSYSQGGDKLTDTPTQSLVKYAQVLNQIGTLQGLLKGESTGPILGILRSKDPYDKKARQIQVAINAMVPTLARGVYGEVGVLTDKDMENYSKTVPNLKSPEEVNNAILAMTLNMLAQGYKNQLRTLASAGKDVSGFGGVYKNIMDQVDVLKTNSSPETLESKGAKHRGKESIKVGTKNYSTTDFND